MVHRNIYQCDSCREEIEIDVAFSANKCHCGGRYVLFGECYNQEFVDEQKYNERQDREYEHRHRGRH